MAQEYEVISHSRFRGLNIFLVRMHSRTMHIHRELEIGLILDGAVTLRTSASTFSLVKEGLYLVNPMEAHEFLAGGNGCLILSIQISPKLPASFFPEPQSFCFTGSSHLQGHYPEADERCAMLRVLCVELAYTYLSCKPGSEYKCFSLTAQLLHRLLSDIPHRLIRQQDYLPMQQKTDRILSVTDYIEENFTHKLLLEDIARREGISMMYLSHLFKQTLGLSFQEYLKQKRFEYACNLIATTQRKILDISISSGFSDVRYLTKLFLEHFGCTPKEYRSTMAGRPGKRQSPPESTEYIFTPQDGFLLLTPIRNQLKSAQLPTLTLMQWLTEDPA